MMVKKKNTNLAADGQQDDAVSSDVSHEAVSETQLKAAVGKKIKVKLVLNELRGIAGKDYSAGAVVMTGELSIPGMTADDLNRGFAIKQIVAEEGK